MVHLKPGVNHLAALEVLSKELSLVTRPLPANATPGGYSFVRSTHRDLFFSIFFPPHLG